jgi:DNA-binding FadR family transcriptional regulator
MEENVRDRSREAAKEIRRFIEKGIIDNTLAPGDKLPTERDLAIRYRAGRNTIRKTLVALENEGKIERSVGRGTFIKGSATRPSLGFFGFEDALTDVPISKSASPLDLMEEPSIARLAVERASSADIEAMQRAIDRSRKAGSLQEFEDCDGALHKTIAMSCRNPLFLAVTDLIINVRTEAEWGNLKKRTLTPELRILHTEEHVEIVDAIRRRDGGLAYAAMEKHLRNVKNMMFPALGP